MTSTTLGLKNSGRGRAWVWSLWSGLITLAVLLSTGCGQAAPPSSLANCPEGACLTSTPPATVSAPTASPQTERGLSSTPRPAIVVNAPLASPAPVVPESAATPIAFQSEAAALGPIVWASAIDPETRSPRDTAAFFSSETATLYATFAVHHLAAGTTVSAQWSYNRTRLNSFDQVLTAEAAATDTWIEFHLALTQPGTWPAGTYAVDILVNNQPALTGAVDVQDLSS